MLTGKCIVLSGIVKCNRNKFKIDSGIKADRKEVWVFLASYLESTPTLIIFLNFITG